MQEKATGVCSERLTRARLGRAARDRMEHPGRDGRGGALCGTLRYGSWAGLDWRPARNYQNGVAIGKRSISNVGKRGDCECCCGRRPYNRTIWDAPARPSVLPLPPATNARSISLLGCCAALLFRACDCGCSISGEVVTHGADNARPVAVSQTAARPPG